MSARALIRDIYAKLIRKVAANSHMLATLYGGSYMGASVLLNLLNELRKRDKMRRSSRILSHFRNEFNKFNNTGTRLLDSIKVT